MKKWVYLFTEGNANMRELLGGKGANLAEMTNIGLPVPQGFTITTEACTQYYEDGREINEEIQGQINEYITKMEEITGKKFGDHENPLLVSVRSGARASMPGMMDTILNLGLNETVVNVIAEKSGNPRWAWDCYRRFIQMYSDVVMEVGKKYFEQLIDAMKEKKGVKQDVELTADDLKELAGQFKAEYKAKIGVDFPDDPKEQLMGAIKAVFRSWDNPRANVYRRDNDIPYSWGTAVNVQSMAFGNMGDDCGTGVAFTRDPATGAKGLFGEFLTNAQGEDVVAGVRTPMKIAEMADKFPEAFAQFQEVCKTLEDHYRDMQDMEFTVEHGKLYMLQTRNGKRTAQAALKIACDLVDEGMRTEEEAVAMIDPRNLDTLLHPQFDTAALKAATPIGKGLGASPGAACGKIVFTAEDAEEWHARGERVVLRSGPGGRREGHAGRRADHGRGRCGRRADGRQNRKERDEKQHREPGRRRNDGHENLAHDVAAREHEVRGLEKRQGLHGDVDERLRGADAVHVGRKAARRHDEKARSGALLRGDAFERREDVEEPEARSLHAFGKEVDARERDEDEQDEARKEEDHVRGIALQKRPARDDRHEDGNPG